MTTKLKFRPHHFLCTIAFQGRGYSPDFVSNYKIIHKYLENHPDIQIEVVMQTDDICAACPHKRGTLCEDQEKVASIDHKHATILELHPGDQISWHEAKQLVANKMSIESFHIACEGCEWKKYGICQAALKKLISE